ncbi:dynamin family protein [Roseobacter sinensis]|uniref:Dynamin family protein n=1 Tax=Roseobacter sinensis TaxID=2931391 RepID=A0ABT3BHU3_9RHOB|nr:dynamin family protein [Roseobacter sp. WL0113]MCV3273122.1 dynamin family protein [Roseobacter sp. WL0113]
MNALTSSNRAGFQQATRAQLLGLGLGPMGEIAAARDRLREALAGLQELGDSGTAKRAERLARQLETFEPSVTLIGQIKSGKTSLVNALIGQPDLLPADVNPWTSVVTSLHLHPEAAGFTEAASFQFFDEDEWDRLISGGGRIGELASRAGADEELEKIKAQVAEMREKSRQRLGRKFELLLGQQRDYGYVDKDLIERYVCLGDEPDGDDPDVSDEQGRFADITKSADLDLQCPGLPIRLCLRDTPGVNDTFMMREQITIRAIRDSRICVVVLSAHQALSSTDLALIRLITHVKSRDVIIFVNRVDELSDPKVQIPQIRASIAETLARHKGPEDAEVIFGSALWASHALEGRLEDLPQASADALLDWSEQADLSQILADEDTHDPVTLAWGLSGVPQLQRAVSGRVAEGLAHATLHRIGTSALNLSTAISARHHVSSGAVDVTKLGKLERTAARARLDEILTSQAEALRTAFDSILAEFSDRMDRVQASFLDRATASLIVHLEKHGDGSPWTYDPAGLRMLLGSSHKVLARKSKATFEAATQTVRDELATLYAQAFGLGPDQMTVAQPPAPDVPAPVTLGRTIALDLNGSWWKRWWLHRRGYKAYAASFHDLIKAETDPFVDELRDDLAQGIRSTALEAFDSFLAEQHSVFLSLDEMAQADPAEMRDRMAAAAPSQSTELLRKTLDILSEYAT